MSRTFVWRTQDAAYRQSWMTILGCLIGLVAIMRSATRMNRALLVTINQPFTNLFRFEVINY